MRRRVESLESWMRRMLRKPQSKSSGIYIKDEEEGGVFGELDEEDAEETTEEILRYLLKG
jgi:hypothetical protein